MEDTDDGAWRGPWTAGTTPPPATAPTFRSTAPGGLAAAVLDAVDYGLILADAAGRVEHISRAARQELKDSGCVEVVQGCLRARVLSDQVALARALADAGRGLRRLLLLGSTTATHPLWFALLPTQAMGAPFAPEVTLILGRSKLCEDLSVECFAVRHDLSGKETSVLKHLCRGLEPHQVAAAQGVEMSTVRTQIKAIREKTGAPSIRALVQMLAVLPPIVHALRD